MAGPAPASEVKAEKKPSGILDLIERVGNKVPHPAILFVALCVAVIILSQILYLAGARITTEEVKPPSAAVQEEYVGGSVLPAYQLPAEPAPADSYHVVHETVRVQGLLTIEGIRYLFTSFVSNLMGFTAMGIILVVDLHHRVPWHPLHATGRAPARRLRPDPCPVRRGAPRRAGRLRRHLSGRRLARTALGRAGLCSA